VLRWCPDINRSFPNVVGVVELDAHFNTWLQVGGISDAGVPGCSAVHAKTDLPGDRGVVEFGIVIRQEVHPELYISILSARDDSYHTTIGSILLTHGVALGRNPVHAVVDDQLHVIKLCVRA